MLKESATLQQKVSRPFCSLGLLIGPVLEKERVRKCVINTAKIQQKVLTRLQSFSVGAQPLYLFALLFLYGSSGLPAQSTSVSDSKWIDLAMVDTLLDLTPHITYHIDEAPFFEYSEIFKKSFGPIDEDELHEQWLIGAERRFWLKINLSNNSDLVMRDYKLYLGIADRVFLYKIENESVELVAKKGVDYREHRNEDFPFYFDFPIAILPGDSVQYMAHLSSSFIPESFESIDPQIVKRGYENHLYEASRRGLKLGLLYAATLSILFIFFAVGMVLYSGIRERALLAFSLLCLSFVVYYIRDLDVFISSVEFLNIGNENISRSEPLCRSFINAGFLFFTFSYFKQFKFRHIFKWTSVGVVSIGVLSGLWTLLCNRVGPLVAYSDFDLGMFVGYILISLLNSLCILGTLWFSIENYSKFYIIGTIFFLLCNYSGLFVESLFPAAGIIPHFNNYASLLGVFLFSMAMVYMIIQRILENEKQVILKTAEVQQLNEINQAKSEFYTNITHEFRTPLTVILGMASSLKNNVVEKNLIIKNAKSLLSLVNQILSHSSQHDDAATAVAPNTDIVNCLTSILEPLKYHAEQKYIDVIITAHPREIIMDINTEGIQQVINNLVYNAIKFSPPHTTIRIDLKKVGAQLQCTICDEGIGIDADQLPFIFDRYYQIEPTIQTDSNLGSGLGLSIVKETIAQLNGTITVKSEVTKGTCFTVLIPINRANPEDEPRNLVFASDPDLNTAEIVQPHILIIEDNEDVLLYTLRCLEGHYQISSAKDGKSGLALAKEHLPDLILSDVMMPKMDGLQLTRHLKKDVRTDHIPVILLTAKATHGEMIEGLSAGADDYLYKPFDRQELLLRIENIISGRKRTAEKNRLLLQEESAPLPKWLERFETLISSHLSTPVTSDWLSEQMQLSRSQIHRKVKSLTGLTTVQYVKQIKIKHAKFILQSSQDSIDVIAKSLGFKSVSYFSATFKEIIGVTPSQWRKRKGHRMHDS